MKRELYFALIFVTILLFTGCKKDTVDTPLQDTNTNSKTDLSGDTKLSDTDYHKEAVKPESQQPDISSTLFSQMPDTFYFLSGAGAWQTQLYLMEDGSFTGIYRDTEAGAADPQKWPNGTTYICEFSGTFTQPEKVDDYTYSVHVKSLEYAEPDTVTYEDGYRYITSNPYGLDNVDEVLIYLPGYPVSELPEEVFSWIRSSGEEFWDVDTPETLPFYALNNVNEQMGFSSKTQSKTTQTETNNIPTTQDSNNKEENRIDKEDIFIKSHSLLKNTPFYTATIDNVKEKCLEKLDITYSEEKSDGYLTYYKGDGITYITTEDGSLYSIILTNNKYEFGCGLKVGLDESEISNLDISFRIYNKDEIGVDKKVNSYLLSYEIGPLSMFDFDTLYYYSATLYDENKTESHVDGFTGRCMGLMAFMKGGKLIAVSTDWPNAN